ncbi:4Fe-4S binding protein [uncultured Draconibacterium sp.]|uniref:4Fe-4S binding protein n=1 Tax=uncultured Draconibacterium sp. TaxID=1573823 RepID=UPI003216C03C
MNIEQEIKNYLNKNGVSFIHFTDISFLNKSQNNALPNAILFGIVLSPAYIQKVGTTTNYVEKMKQNDQIQNDEFHLTEIKTDRLADELADYLQAKGFSAFSQSEANLKAHSLYNKLENSTPLPHKTIARLAGLGWIGKHNLLVTPQFGSAISMCTVLTDAPVNCISALPMQSLCGSCSVCVDVCPTNAIYGNSWEAETSRDNLIDFRKCITCLECMVQCPWTQKQVGNTIYIP